VPGLAKRAATAARGSRGLCRRGDGPFCTCRRRRAGVASIQRDLVACSHSHE